MLRLKRHIVTEIIEVFLAVILVVMLIMISFQFTKLLAEAVAGKITGGAIYQLLALRAISLCVLLVPFAFFFAVFLSLSRLATNNELIAMRSIGYSYYDIYQSIFFFAAPLAMVVLLISLFVLPEIEGLNKKLTLKAKKESELSILQPGKFRSVAGGAILFVGDVDDGKFSKFFMSQRTANGKAFTTAKKGEISEKDGVRHLHLYSGSRYSEFNDKTSQLISFETLEMLLPNLLASIRKSALKSMSAKELFNSNDLPKKIELQARASSAISIILLAFFAPLLVQFNPRSRSSGRFVIAILIYAIYSNSQHVFRSLVEDGKLPLFPGIYLSHVIFLLIVFVWLLFSQRIHFRGRVYAKKA